MAVIANKRKWIEFTNRATSPDIEPVIVRVDSGWEFIRIRTQSKGKSLVVRARRKPAFDLFNMVWRIRAARVAKLSPAGQSTVPGIA